MHVDEEQVVEELVVLVDADGHPVGTRTKSSVHTADTPLHLAFSIYLFDDAGRVLFTRRALSKKTWPGVWTNTCCGHPGPGEDMTDAIARRLEAELGLTARDIRCVLPAFAYQALDASGIRENERCPVYLGTVEEGSVAARPDEVMEWAWISWPDLVVAVNAAPFGFSPWSVEQIALLDRAIDAPVGSAAK